MSSDGWDMFTPPRAESCGVFGNLKKLKTAFPPSVWAEINEANKTDSMERLTRNTLRKYGLKKKSPLFHTQGGFTCFLMSVAFKT